MTNMDKVGLTEQALARVKAGVPKALPGKVHAVGVDRLRVGISSELFDTAYSAEVLEQLEDGVRVGKLRRLSAAGKKYRDRYQLKFGEESLLIELGPRAGASLYAMCIEFTPNNLTDDQLQRLRRNLRRILGPEREQDLLSGALVTRLDVNVDFEGVLDQLLIYAPNKVSGALYRYQFQGSGTLGTLYIGAPTSHAQIRIYDKAAEELRKHFADLAPMILQAIAAGRGSAQLTQLRKAAQGLVPLVRLEVANTFDRGGLPLSRLNEMTSVFNSVRVMALPNSTGVFDTPTGRLFIDSARMNGVNVALKRAGNENRKLHAALSREPLLELWQPNRFAEHVGLALIRLQSVFPAVAFGKLVPDGVKPLPVCAAPLRKRAVRRKTKLGDKPLNLTTDDERILAMADEE